MMEFVNDTRSSATQANVKPANLVQQQEFFRQFIGSQFRVLKGHEKALLQAQLEEQPQITIEREFVFAYHETFASACADLLESVPQIFVEAMRLELEVSTKIHQNWTLCLKVDPVTWFDEVSLKVLSVYILLTDEQHPEKCVKNAMQYVESKKVIISENHSTTDQPTIQAKEYCQYQHLVCAEKTVEKVVRL